MPILIGLTRFEELGIAPTACLVSPPSKLTDKLDEAWAKLLRLKTEDGDPISRSSSPGTPTILRAGRLAGMKAMRS